MTIKQEKQDPKSIEAKIKRARAALKRKGIQSEYMKQFVPAGWHGRLVYGKDNVSRYKELGYEIVLDENNKPRYVKDNALHVLMAIPNEVKAVIDAEKRKDALEQEGRSSLENTRQITDPSTGEPVFSNK